MLKVQLTVAAILTILAFLFQGCTSAGHIDNPHIKILGQELGIDRISWGESPTPPVLPDGAIELCDATVNGTPITLYLDATTGNQWYVDPDGDAHEITSGPDLNCGPNNYAGYQGPNPIGGATGIQIQTTDSIDYTFDESNDTASASFTLPVEMIEQYVSASEMPFLANESSVQLPNGDIHIAYSGTINDVLGSLWWIGVKEVEFVDANNHRVKIDWWWNVNMVTIYVDGISQTREIQATNPANLHE